MKQLNYRQYIVVKPPNDYSDIFPVFLFFILFYLIFFFNETREIASTFGSAKRFRLPNPESF